MDEQHDSTAPDATAADITAPVSTAADATAADATVPASTAPDAKALDTTTPVAAAHDATAANVTAPVPTAPVSIAPDAPAPVSTAAASIAPVSTAPPTKARSGSTFENKVVTRPFRVKLRGSVLVLVRLPNRRSVRAKFHQLSTSGGVIHVEKPLEEKLEVEMIFHVGQATIRNKAQMLFPMWATQGWMQPFRFVDLPEADRQVLDTNLKSFLTDAANGAAAGA